MADRTSSIFEEHPAFFERMTEALSTVAAEGYRKHGRGVVLLHFHDLTRADHPPCGPIPMYYQPDMRECRDARLVMTVDTYDPNTEMVVVVGWVEGEQRGRFDVARMRVSSNGAH
jgi:hypothetical protein